MLLTWNNMLLAAVAAMLMAISTSTFGHGPELVASRVQVPDLVELRHGAFDYRAAGEFTRGGKPVTAPIVRATIKRTLAVMRHQVTAADYRQCVEAEACPMVDRELGRLQPPGGQGQLAGRPCLCVLAVARDGGALPATN